MAKPEKDPAREERIHNEIVVDAYGEEERAIGWHCYLSDTLQFPFTAACIAKRPTSPLRVKDKVEVTGMASEDECIREVFVMIRWKNERLAVPLSQLRPIGHTDEETREAVADWHYWVKMGYEF